MTRMEAVQALVTEWDAHAEAYEAEGDELSRLMALVFRRCAQDVRVALGDGIVTHVRP